MPKPNQTLLVQLPLFAELSNAFPAREMVRGDIPELVELWLASYPPDVIDGAGQADIEADWRAAFDGDYGRMDPDASLLVEENGRVIAAVQTVVDAVWDHTPAGPFIIELIVHPSARGRGLAKHLMVRALRNLTMAGYESAGLRVEADNTPALALYRSLGFHPV